jgi:hypothetical protein
MMKAPTEAPRTTARRNSAVKLSRRNVRRDLYPPMRATAVGRGHDEGLVDADGAAQEVGEADEGEVCAEEGEAGEPGLPDDVAEGGGVAAAGVGGDFHLAALRERGVCGGAGGMLAAEHRRKRMPTNAS